MNNVIEITEGGRVPENRCTDRKAAEGQTDIEIWFKQDMSIGCDDLGKLCRAPEEIEKQWIRFCSVWQVIEEAELAGEYDAWKAANPNEKQLGTGT